MEEIKFRQYIGGKMNYWGFLNGSFRGPAASGNENPFNTTQMQFTGLHDKNGKEIYKGDIVQLRGRSKWRVVWLQEKARYQMVHDENNPRGFSLTENTIFTDKCEVIGNIYENPELLKGHDN